MFIVPDTSNEGSERLFNHQDALSNGRPLSCTASDTFTKGSERLFIDWDLSFICRDRLYDLYGWLNYPVGVIYNPDRLLINVLRGVVERI
ncbi:hypothetical protein NAL32_00245 [Chryseobacterium sp. Ch-15]|uniref:Uncharacterized protein n=1 Tax=Chryseobacterium muglaense TaxID=2893752 RepID=A0ABR8LYK9_9FLAO|nr:hypothetical protein [Chryseobacterium muglaense]MBD3903477.1 hypothetical protein [Chryseobacterium muglaense]MCM2552812.1 hypothetical protein [Chryseobacterium muglaense]